MNRDSILACCVLAALLCMFTEGGWSLLWASLAFMYAIGWVVTGRAK